MVEKIARGTETLAALRALEAHLGRRADATMPIEYGGMNSMIPLIVGARAGLPVIDADGMGRAFPELQMETCSRRRSTTSGRQRTGWLVALAARAS